MYQHFSQNIYEIHAAIIRTVVPAVVIQVRKLVCEEFKYLTPSYTAVSDIARF